jgi:beta-lactamase regulating signal transducer with metallopeptidase domain
MTALFDTVGPAVWRSSWQAATLAFLIFVLLRLFGDRLTPRWRYLLLSVVLVRLLFIGTPASSWSIFNLTRWQYAGITERISHRSEDDAIASEQQSRNSARQLSAGSYQTATERPPVGLAAQRTSAEHVSEASGVVPPTVNRLAIAIQWTTSKVVKRVLWSLWLAGCILSLLQLLATAIVLRRRLSACRSVTDPDVLGLLKATVQRVGLTNLPALLVSPESISPCIVGTWNPRLVIPESIMMESPPTRLRHVLAHELAHLVRGDLWTNWLLLTARILHWFNPVAWWTVREMQVEREAACDEIALAALGEGDRSAYATTIIDLVENLVPSALAPGIIGLFSSARRLRYRVERLMRAPSVVPLRSSLTIGLLLGIGLLGLTDARPATANDLAADTSKGETAAPAVAANKKPLTKDYAIRGRCVDNIDNSALAHMNVILFKAEGRALPPVEVAHTVTDADGRFEFTGLVPPRPEARIDRLAYMVFAKGAGRPIGEELLTSMSMPAHSAETIEIRVARDKAKVSGRAIDDQGQPVAGATVMQKFFEDAGAIPGILSATTDADGRFVIDDLPVWKSSNGETFGVYLTTVHPDFPETIVQAVKLPEDVTVKLPKGCVVTGSVRDGITGQPTVGSVVTVESLGRGNEAVAATDATGRFRVVVAEGRYNVLVEAIDRVCVAITDQECLAGGSLKLPTMTLVGGGFISGQVINTATGQPVVISESGEPISIGLYGPSQPQGHVIRATPLATVNETGRFVLRAAPGENFPYFVNTHGNRMGWDTQKQPPVIVKEGETTPYNMLITPPVPPEEELKAARKIVASLSDQSSDRTAQIILEFRKLSETVDETELWCMLMRELVAVGKDAVPQLCAELDRTTADRTLRRLAFALRAIGDPRSVPALIRAIPKTLVAPSSDYGLIVEDRELAVFMQKHDLRGNAGGKYFDFGRPSREIFGALHVLTGQDFGDAELFSVSLSEDPRRAVLQRRIYLRQAERWQAWWEAHSQEMTVDAAYQKVNLPVVDEKLPPETRSLSSKARLASGVQGEILSPVAQDDAQYFLDLDTGYQPGWPAQIGKDESQLDKKQLAEWAAENGVDLMCVTHRSADGTPTFVLRAFDMEVWEISQRDLRNIDKLIAGGTLPKGRAVNDFLMHYDSDTQQFVPDANAAFVFVTREGNMGLIETTDRVTRTANLTGAFGDPPPGVGFFKGVRFNWKAIIP